jgi:hypothetical protein
MKKFGHRILSGTEYSFRPFQKWPPVTKSQDFKASAITCLLYYTYQKETTNILAAILTQAKKYQFSRKKILKF